MEKETNNRKLSIIEHLVKNRCRNILMSSLVSKNHQMTINFDLTEKEYKEISQNALNNHNYLLNEYKEKIEMTKDEFIILKNVDKKYQWITRDKYNRLFLYKDKPYKGNDSWYGKIRISLTLFNHLFQFIKWEDEEPTNIQELLNNCEVIGDVE